MPGLQAGPSGRQRGNACSCTGVAGLVSDSAGFDLILESTEFIEFLGFVGFVESVETGDTEY